MLALSFITWDIDPNIITYPKEIRYYGLLFGLAFFASFSLIKKMFEHENISEEWLDKLLMYCVGGTVIGARLGHVFFYDWEYYSQHLLEIPQVWKGGLASHGAAIAIVIAMWAYSKFVTKGTKSMFWTLDKVVIGVALSAAFIRVGNLMNSEIIGGKSESNSAFFFKYPAKQSISSYFFTTEDLVEISEPTETDKQDNFNYPVSEVSVLIESSSIVEEDVNDFFNKFNYYKNYNYEPENENSWHKEEHFFVTKDKPTLTKTVDGFNVHFKIGIIPRIPTQLLEAASYFVIFLLLIWGYWKRAWYKKEGLIFGIFFLLMFSARFIIEFWKVHQTDALANAELNMGQWLSIPGILIGVVFIAFSLTRSKKEIV